MKSSFISAGKPGTKAKNPSNQSSEFASTNGSQTENGNTPGNGNAPANETGTAWSEPTHEQIANLACQLYIESGRQEGRDAENWLRAEQLLRQRSSRQGTSVQTRGMRKPVSASEPRSREQF